MDQPQIVLLNNEFAKVVSICYMLKLKWRERHYDRNRIVHITIEYINYSVCLEHTTESQIDWIISLIIMLEKWINHTQASCQVIFVVIIIIIIIIRLKNFDCYHMNCVINKITFKSIYNKPINIQLLYYHKYKVTINNTT